MMASGPSFRGLLFLLKLRRCLLRLGDREGRQQRLGERFLAMSILSWSKINIDTFSVKIQKMLDKNLPGHPLNKSSLICDRQALRSKHPSCLFHPLPATC